MKRIFLILLFTIHCSLFTVFGQQGEWTWMNGDSSSTSIGHYGIKGVFDSTNFPGGVFGAAQWTDKNGNFWFFGGLGYGPFLDDLWEYNTTINQWAWMKGTDSTGVYAVPGIQNVPSPLNNPGSRIYGTAAWVDTSGNLWFFGGRGYDFNGTWGSFNDLWKYDISTNEWTWVKGADTVCSNGYYGILGVENINNNPPQREDSKTTWTDNNNNLWLFGGSGGWCSNSDYYSDLWRFNIATNSWTWMKGDSIPGQLSVYGIKGIPDPANKPSARVTQACWKSINDDFWLFGGFDGGGFKNDLWRYNIISNQWTWMGGTNLANDSIGFDNGQCIPDSNNFPKSRGYNNSWTRPCDNFATFGGVNSYLTDKVYNDLWNYNVFTNQWTMMNGSLTPNQPQNFGSFNIPSPSNNPGSREYYLCWIDNSASLYIYGGSGNSVIHSNMWKFVPDTTCPVFIHSDTLASAFNALPLNGCSPLTVTFNNLSVNGTNFQWIFGDSTSSTTVNATHVYNSPGTYHVKLISLSKCSGLIDSSFTTITVLPDPNPIIISSGPTTFCPGDSVSLNAGNYSSFLWNNNSTNQSIIVFDSGIYIVTVTDVNGCTGTASQIISIIPPIQVTASFIADTLQGCAPLTINFSNTSINGTSYLWNFGDGSTGTALNPAHTYTDIGTFTVTLTAVNDTSQCGRYSNTNSINIVVGKLEAVSSGFTATTDYGCAPLMVDFTNNSINATAYYWLFGNGEVDSAKNPPTITYPDSGTYAVTLIAFNESPLCPTSPDVKTLDITVGECDLYFPNVITPNGDQMNDIFQFTAKGYTNCNLTIFNRWGQQVYASPLTDSFWDGTWNLSGEKVVDGTYYYLFTATDFYRKPFTQKGSILVIW